MTGATEADEGATTEGEAKRLLSFSVTASSMMVSAAGCYCKNKPI
jgi:hypothetical protein